MRGIYVLPLKDAGKGRQRRSRILQRLTVWPGQTPVNTGDGWAGENRVRFASSLAAALLTAFLRILHGSSVSSQTSISVTATEVGMSFSTAC